MAVLTNDDFTKIKKYIRQDETYRQTFKDWGLDKPSWKGAFQNLEDWFVDAISITPTTTWKAAIEVATGAATNAQAKATAWVWGKWRAAENP